VRPDGRGFYDEMPWDNEAPQDTLYVEGRPLLRNSKPAFRMTPKAWRAYERGERYCARCKWESNDVDVFGCEQCGERLFGRAA
jgi:hypothetical protein